mgnify:CR=1 FL=1
MSFIAQAPRAASVGLFSPTRILGILFFFSGFAALIYQIIWQRALFRILGVNIEAVTIVVTAFMIGLGLGSLAGGALSRRLAGRAIPLLAAIEALTALYGVFSLGIFEKVGAMATDAPLAGVAAVALGLVLVPTLLMGATLPVLVAHLTRTSGLTGESVGYLYYVNTVGAAWGCLAGALLIFPFIGMQASIWMAATINIIVSVFALWLHFTTQEASAPPAPPASGQADALMPFGTVLALGALGGFVSLSCEIFLVRLMYVSTTSLANAFAITLAAFLIGIAAGSREAGELHKASPQAQKAHVSRELAKALIAIAFCLPVLRWLGWLQVMQMLIIGLVAYFCARGLGMLLPYLADRGVTADERTGQRISWLYMANIAGSAAGGVMTGFVLMDLMTTQQIALSLVILTMLTLVAFARATGATLRTRALAPKLAWAAAGVLVLLLASGKLWDRLILKETMGYSPPVTETVENRSGVINVLANGVVYGGGIYDGRFNTDLVDDLNGAFRPFAVSLLHPAPRKVLMIGLSSGSWARIVASHPQVESLTVIEINPGYVALAGRHKETASILNDPKIKIIDDDGRRWLTSHPDERFDAIVANVTFNYRANVTNLLSREFIDLVAAHLAPGGIHFYNTTFSNRVQRTACLAMPQGLRFSNHMALSREAIDVDFDRWRETLLAYRIDGRAVLDLSHEKDAAKLAELMSSRDTWRENRRESDFMETCASVLARTKGLEPVTDDNMGTEWRVPLGLE